MKFNEADLTKGQIRKLTALRKSLGNKIADKAFEEWRETQATDGGEQEDKIVVRIEELLAPLANDKTFKLGTYGYTIRRTKGRGKKPGFVATKNVKK